MPKSKRGTAWAGEDEPGDVEETLRAQVAYNAEVTQELKLEIAALRRELEIWQKRNERAELEAMKWRTAAQKWRIEFMKIRRDSFKS